MTATKREPLHLSALAKYAWAVVVYSLAVIAWGAFVRATGSGAGCGEHWPLCNGEVVPRTPQMETLIELTHRITSGLSLMLVVTLFVWTFRATPKRHPARAGATLSIIFIITEALVGAGLVLFGLVAKDESISRAVVMSIHLINTLLLVAALGLTAWWASGADASSLRERFARGRALQSQNFLTALFVLTIIGTLILGISGAVSALGATLFPVTSLREGLRQDFSPTAHLLVRLRVFHPFIATLDGVLLGLAAALTLAARKHIWTQRAAYLLIALVCAEFVAGIINLFLHAPVWLQLVHLVLADLMWLALVLLAASVLLPASPQVENAHEQRFDVGEELAMSPNV
jgi:heme A synthase